MMGGTLAPRETTAPPVGRTADTLAHLTRAYTQPKPVVAEDLYINRTTGGIVQVQRCNLLACQHYDIYADDSDVPIPLLPFEFELEYRLIGHG